MLQAQGMGTNTKATEQELMPVFFLHHCLRLFKHERADLSNVVMCCT